VVDQELVDPIITILSEIIPVGLAVERIYGDVFPDELDQIIVPVRIFGYLPADSQLEETRAQIIKALANIRKEFSIPEPVFSYLEEQDWATAWQVRYRPIPLGDRLIVVPSWLENPSPERISISMDPGMAFGSGTHPTTQLSLVLLEKCISLNPVEDLMDIGCGSGILSIAAAKLGAARILGVDNDPDAVRVSRMNAEQNGIKEAITFSEGSVTEILQKDFDFSEASLVVANIIAPILIELFENGLGELVSKGGNLILSGILREQLPDMMNLLERQRIFLKENQQQDEWAAVWGIKAVS